MSTQPSTAATAQRGQSIAKHTPGPWKINENAAGDIWIQSSVNGFIAKITPAYGQVPEGLKIARKANALLMAASPDLLAALEDLLEQAETTSQWHCAFAALKPNKAQSKRLACHAQARAAIAQARGLEGGAL